MWLIRRYPRVSTIVIALVLLWVAMEFWSIFTRDDRSDEWHDGTMLIKDQFSLTMADPYYLLGNQEQTHD